MADQSQGTPAEAGEGPEFTEATDPFALFSTWMEEAEALETADPEAMARATGGARRGLRPPLIPPPAIATAASALAPRFSRGLSPAAQSLKRKWSASPRTLVMAKSPARPIGGAIGPLPPRSGSVAEA